MSCKECPYVIRHENIFGQLIGFIGNYARRFPIYQCSESEVKRFTYFPDKIPHWCPKYYDEVKEKYLIGDE